jgi:hypothetical protein
MLPEAAAPAPSSAAPPSCPITQEAIQHGVVLRGAAFETAALLDLVAASDGRPRHPYDRRPLTPEELRRVYKAARRHPHTAAKLAELGWADGLPGAAVLVPPCCPAQCHLTDDRICLAFTAACGLFIVVWFAISCIGSC